MKKTIFSVLASVLLPFVGSSQAYDLSEPDRINCGTAIINNQLLLENPQMQLEIDEKNKWYKEFAKNYQENKTEAVIYTIPVVYHIIHNNGAENVSKAAIEASIANLNEDYQKLNSDISQVIPAFAGIAADVQVRFRLAHLDPNGNCTEGITRTVSPLTYAMDDAVKSIVRWDPNSYLNIWVGQTIASGAGGYSYYPSSFDYSFRGIVIRSAQLGNSITHEVGHFLDLPHLWGSSNTPGIPSNCSLDDGINDTPFCEGAQSCNTALVTCGSLDNVQNYMEYSGCSRMFTEGQKVRLHAALNSSVGARSSLWAPANLIATGVADPYTTPVCAPIADFTYNKEYLCEGGSVSFSDDSYNATPTMWNWTFIGGAPNSSGASNPTITYNNAGTYSVTHQPSTIGGSDIETKTNIITVSSLVADYTGAVIESYENASQVNSDWIVENNAQLGWERNTFASTTGTSSMRIRNFFNSTTDEIDDLISPSYDISSVSTKTMTFKQAYAKKTSADDDRLFVYYSTNCGQSWIFGLLLTSANLSTVGSTQLADFVPTTGDWMTRSVDLSTVSNATNVRFKFEFKSGGGNNIYIDDINVGGVVGVADFNNIASFSVYPNPTSSSAQISFNLIKDVNRLNVKVRNAVGQEITNVINDQSFSKGKYTLQIDEQRKLAAGIYFVEFNADDNVKVQKLI
ncbi:MAG: M43 family zinc metalloprotease, partial [Vicingaceae bacterium]|nr:M43 family zinc metalloprotease [Vicingaceae bacterium]